MRAPNLPVLFHPDCNRRLRNRTESADPADCAAGARGLWRLLAITAGGDFHPAPRTRSDRNLTDAIYSPLTSPCNDFCQLLGHVGRVSARLSHRARLMRQKSQTDVFSCKRPESAQPRRCRAAWQRSLHNPIYQVRHGVSRGATYALASRLNLRKILKTIERGGKLSRGR
jgi:hypothetical protein